MLIFRFSYQLFSISLAIVFTLAFTISVAGSIYGIGGGAMMSPILMTIFKLPVYVIASSTLFQTLVTSLSSLTVDAMLGFAPNIPIGIGMGLGGILGGYLGASIQRRAPEWAIKLIVSMLTAPLAIFDILTLLSR